MAKPTFTIRLTAEQFNAMAAKLKSQGYGPEALDSGTLPKTSGVLLSYVTQAGGNGSSTVTFTVQEKPMLVPVSVIEGHVRSLIGIA